MSGYIGTQPIPQSTQTRETFTATASQTSFATGGYQAGYIDVFLNGVKLVDGTDYTATNGSDVVLTTGAASGDTLEVVAYTAFEAANVTGATDFTVTGSFTSRGIDDNATSTAMTLDGSGNLLVGKTVSDFNTQGFEINSGGQLRNSRASGAVAYLNRKTNDGSILEMGKDGATVGSIGTGSGRLSIGNIDTGLEFVDGLDAILPHNMTTNGNRDAAIDFGYPTQRFKDLYLSGGVYLGGTGAANKLDDYEEGTFTPAMSGSTGGSFTVGGNSRSYYKKIGGLVTVNTMIQWTSNASTGSLRITGLPFVAVNTDSLYRTGVAMGYVSGADVDGANFRQLVGTMSGGGTQVDFFLLQDNTSPTTSDAAAWSSSGEIQFSVTYMTNS